MTLFKNRSILIASPPKQIEPLPLIEDGSILAVFLIKAPEGVNNPKTQFHSHVAQCLINLHQSLARQV